MTASRQQEQQQPTDRAPFAERRAPTRSPAGPDVPPGGARDDRRATPRTSGRRRTDDGPWSIRYAIEELVGASPSMVAARAAAWAAASREGPVLVAGEEGTGKRTIARAIHDGSALSAAPFVIVRCAAAGDPVAVAGCQCAGTTLYLDEVTALPLVVQERLLAGVDVVHAPGTARTPVRIIAATRRPPDEAMRTGDLHPGLLDARRSTRVELAPLRDRLADVPALAAHFLAQAGEEVGLPSLRYAPAVVEALARHCWTGNVRELRALVRRLASTSVGGTITIGQLPPDLLAGLTRG